MQLSFTQKKHIRKNFGKLAEGLSIPNLIEVQKNSYNEFLESKSLNQQLSELSKGIDKVFIYREKDILWQFQKDENERPHFRPKIGIRDTSFEHKINLKIKQWGFCGPESPEKFGAVHKSCKNTSMKT